MAALPRAREAADIDVDGVVAATRLPDGRLCDWLVGVVSDEVLAQIEQAEAHGDLLGGLRSIAGQIAA